MRSIQILTFSRIVFLCLITAFTGAFLLYSPAPAIPETAVDFLGEATLPAGFSFKRTELGGLSGITYDPSQQIYYAIADDRSKKAPARFYTLKINLKESLKDGDVVPIDVTTLLDETNQPFAADSLDPEGIALTNKGTVFISSEGNAERLIEPFIKEFSLSSGRQLQTLTVPSKFLPTASHKRGIRNNLAFESLTITPNQKYLFTATENALFQDGPGGTKSSSPLRILQYNLRTYQLEQELLYIIQPVAAPLKFLGNLSSGLVDLLALDNQGHFLSLERAFNGLGYTIQLFEVYAEGATDIRDVDSLSTVDLSTIEPVHKQLLLNFQTLSKVTLDNIEGLTFGPQLPDGRQSLIVVSDNNFQSAQRTQILALGIKSLTNVENNANILDGGNKGL